MTKWFKQHRIFDLFQYFCLKPDVGGYPGSDKLARAARRELEPYLWRYKDLEHMWQ
jgi:hypothetical protein